MNAGLPAKGSRVAGRSLAGLNWLNFFVAQMQLAFGAFLSVYLATHEWSRADIGFALSVGTVTAMAAQAPAGALVDAVHSKRCAAAAAIAAIAGAALIVAATPRIVPVLMAEVLHGTASCVLAPAIAAMTLAIAHHDNLGERFGRNVRYSALGSMIAAAVMGAMGYRISHRAIFYLAALCGVAALVALRTIHEADLEAAPTRTDHISAVPRRHRKGLEAPKVSVCRDRILVIFGACLILFQLGNAALLPIAATQVSNAIGQRADLVIGAAIFVPQALAAMLSPYMGRLAQTRGRRAVLLLGLVPLPLRALLFALNGNPYVMVLFQALDGISAAVVGMIVPLVVADITRRRGRFNLAMGVVGLGMGVGAAISTTLAGLIADRFGNSAAFAALAGAGLAACLLAWLRLPETGQLQPRRRKKLVASVTNP